MRPALEGSQPSFCLKSAVCPDAGMTASDGFTLCFKDVCDKLDITLPGR